MPLQGVPPTGILPQTELRIELDRLTTEFTYTRIREQEPAIRSLNDRLPHSLELVGEALPGHPETYQFTCFQYALQLIDLPTEVTDICRRFDDIYPSPEFVLFLIDRDLRETPVASVETGDIVVYFSQGRPTHAALVHGELVVSKWGLAHVWRHKVGDVPLAYGDVVRTFKPLGRAAVLEAFLKFVAQKLGRESL